MELCNLQRYGDLPFGVGRKDDGEYLKYSDVEKLLNGERILKPCPCCGNKDPEIVEYPPQENDVRIYHSKRYSVLCRFNDGPEGCGLESGHYKTEDEAVEAWERRV